MQELDKDLFLLINSHYAEWLDTLMYYISQKYTWIPLYLSLLLLLIKKYKSKIWVAFVFVALMILASDQLANLFKDTFERLRPCHEPSLEGMVHLVRNKCGGLFGFLSSHASNTAALSVFIIGLFGSHIRVLVWVMITWTLLNMYSRIYLGVHYPSDVIAGMFFGSLIGFAFLKGYFYIMDKYLTRK